MMKYLLLALLSLEVAAAVGSEVLIRGKIGNEFDENKIKVVDSDKQVYFLPRKYFPKDVPVKQGQEFSIEIDESELKNIKLLKK